MNINKPIVITSFGEYSDYCVVAILNWLDKGTPEEARSAFIAANPPNDPDEDPVTGYRDGLDTRFVAYLLREGWAEEVEARELNFGAYSAFFSAIELKRHDWRNPHGWDYTDADLAAIEAGKPLP